MKEKKRVCDVTVTHGSYFSLRVESVTIQGHKIYNTPPNMGVNLKQTRILNIFTQTDILRQFISSFYASLQEDQEGRCSSHLTMKEHSQPFSHHWESAYTVWLSGV